VRRRASCEGIKQLIESDWTLTPWPAEFHRQLCGAKSGRAIVCDEPGCDVQASRP